MTETAPTQGSRLMAAASKLVAVYAAHNHVAVSAMPGLIMSVHASLSGLLPGEEASAQITAEPEHKPTANEISKSITPDALISFLDGKPYKMLKRHLTTHGLTPQGYRTRFGLPADYPVVAPSYASRRSALAKEHRFGIAPGLGAKHRLK